MTAGPPKKKYKSKHKKMLPSTVQYNHLAHLSKPVPITGSDISKVTETHDLHLTEVSLMLGLNTSSLYEKKKKDDIQPANISILLRLYTALPQYIPKLVPPPIENLILKIQDIDPNFDRSWIGILLGLEKNSSFRLRREGIDHGAQTTKVLSDLIYKIITDDPKNWFLIREVIETESAARQINPAEKVWTDGGWNRSLEEKTDSEKKIKLKPKDQIVLSSSLENDET